MIAEIAVLTVLDLAIIGHRGASALPVESMAPGNVFTGAIGVTMMFAFMSFIGFESAALYGEETRNPKRSVPLATYTSVIVVAVFYALTSWAAVGGVGSATCVRCRPSNSATSSSPSPPSTPRPA